MNAAILEDKNRRIALLGVLAALLMLGLGFAAVPLYRIFCQVTGFAGTTQRATAEEAASVKATSLAMSVRFDANVAPNLPWTFEPEQVTQDIRIGERAIAFFIARNNSDQPVTGQASYNVEPEQTAPFFNKVQCFCFTRQTLQPHQEVRMPVLYYVDPKILDDENSKGVEQITLSYTFHRLEEPSS